MKYFRKLMKSISPGRQADEEIEEADEVMESSTPDQSASGLETDETVEQPRAEAQQQPAYVTSRVSSIK